MYKAVGKLIALSEDADSSLATICNDIAYPLLGKHKQETNDVLSKLKVTLSGIELYLYYHDTPPVKVDHVSWEHDIM